MPPKLNRRRAELVLSRIDAILAWEARHENERDTRFVELGKYLCEVRAGQYWRLEKLKSFDEFLERRFPESRRKAYYLMSIHEQLPPQVRKELNKWDGPKGWSWPNWHVSRVSTSKVQPGCTRPDTCLRRNSSGKWRKSSRAKTASLQS
jgi:hypothetical protein